MSNLNTPTISSSVSTLTGNTGGVWNGVPCGIHGWTNCTCNTLGSIQYSCSVCGQPYINGIHVCGSNGTMTANTYCPSCGQSFNHMSGHVCPSFTTGTTTFPINGTWVSQSNFKEVKEITTDAELIYEWTGSSFYMRLPAKFSDCFLKVGYAWSPLYPLIFTALENDATTMSFHLVIGITDKTFEGDKVVLKGVTTTKIEDNLTLLQLTNRVSEYFKEDAKTDSAL